MRMTFTRRLLGVLLLTLVLGCGDGTAPPASISVSVAPTTASLLTGISQDFTATVANDPGAKGVTWTVAGCAGGVAACGSLTNVTNTKATYTAPAPIPSDAQLGITATSVTDNTKAFTVTVAITAIRVSVSPAAGSVAVNGTRLFAAAVENDPTNSGVTWRLTGCTGGAAVCGSLTNVTNTVATYTAPATVPPGTLGITATSVSDNTKAFTATVTVIAIGIGGQIAFVSTSDGSGHWGIYVMKADGSGVTRLDTGGDVNAFVWSPDGTRIAFVSVGTSAEIYVMNADGSGQVNLTNSPGDNARPAWSPDGTRIAFNSSRDGNNREIYVMNADGSGQVNLTNNPGFDDWPVWSPDGTRIAFSSTRDGNNEIYVMHADGSGVTRLMNTSGALAFVWSPDGTRIAFMSSRDGNYEIYVINADGSGVTQLTASSLTKILFVNPVWSPDGSKIAYQRDSIACGSRGCGIARAEIYVMNADGSAQVNLTNNSGRNLNPAWSPDGKKIAFDGNYDIYVMNADGSGQVNLTNSPGGDHSPAWRPR